MSSIEPAVAASEDRHYQQLGLQRGQIAEWEDGIRTDTTSGTYEWWYFDTYLEDGAKLVVVFYTKDFATPERPLEPMITIDLDLPDGRHINKRTTFDATEFQASSQGCDVRIGNNHFQGNLHDYSIKATVEEIMVNIQLHSLTEAWRPETGVLLYGAQEEKNFCWLPSVPYGSVTVTYSIGTDLHQTTGTGYHDHNWGNTPLISLVNNWYWGRGKLGPYAFISAYIVNEKHYGYAPFPIFMLARDGKIIADDSNKVTFSKSEIHTDEPTGKPVADVTRYVYEDGDTRYQLTYQRQETILRQEFINQVKGLKWLAAKAIGFDGAYLRFSGKLQMEQFKGEQVVEHYESDAIWELMYFGSHKHEEP